MVQEVKVLLSESSENRLRELKGRVIKSISITTAGLPDKQHESAHNMGFLLWISSDDGNYAIYSDLKETNGRINFPELVVSSGEYYPNNDRYLEDKEDVQGALDYLGGTTKVVSIKIVRDRVSLTIDDICYELEVDIGLKLRFIEDEMLIMVRDSSFSLMEFWYGQSQDWSIEERNYQQAYMYETSELRRIERVERDI
ncbi:hypothetical protein [Paenibacillus alvei]|uniref:hypothetical protein n=1 Tax=Paenibacillus alvei TaxID=44250 RepID=UPI0018CD34BF|nr:hypothetical protein [Paenibacillus alvei]MBG9732811.1 hypothetical protein [Paenibacillus alvei]MBG9745418.1 hypothetical protein [Paenibacillus alvei]MCY9582558.1 hypothetical protein [Paenibacillus alvei]MCY9583586.1 hypothetical protein [Paenibacillus alvei]